MFAKSRKNLESWAGKSEKKHHTTESMVDNVALEHPYVDKLHLDWVYRYAIYLGHHYYLPNYTDNMLYIAQLQRESRSVYNLTKGFIDTFISKMLKDKPMPQAFPLSFENKDTQCARISNLILEYLYRKENVAIKQYDAQFWAAVDGIGIIKTFFDGEAGVKIQVGDETMKEGEIKYQVVSPWNFYPDPLAVDMDSSRYIIQTYIQPLRTVKRIFPESAADLVGETIDSYKDVLSAYTNDTTQNEDEDKGCFSEDLVLVKEYWERGVEGYDAGFGSGQGRYLIRANGKTLYDGKNPYEHRLPFFVFTVNKPPDQFPGIGLIQPMLQMQLDTNRVKSQIMENIDWMANVKWAAPRGCNIENNTINKDSGEVIEYDADNGQAPHQMVVQPIPQHVFTFDGVISQAMMNVSGMHEVSFAQMPERGSQMSGKALNQLVEAEAVRFAREIMLNEKAQKDMALFSLYLAKKYWKGEKTISIVGELRNTETITFQTTDLDGQSDLFVDMGNGFGLSPSAKSDIAQMLWDRKIITDPAEILRITEFGQLEKKYYAASQDEMKANQHLKQVLDGVMPRISKYDNHEVFIKVFSDFIRSPEFDLQTRPVVVGEEILTIQDLIEAYVDGHYKAQDALAIEQEAMRIEGQAKLQTIQNEVMPPPPPQQQVPPTPGPEAASPMMMPQDTQAVMDESLSQAQGMPPMG